MEPTTLAANAGAWAWNKYGKTLSDKATGAIKNQWDRLKWKNAAEAYRFKIRKLYGTMQIMGMAEPVPLDDIFTDVFMLSKPTAFARFDIERLKKLAADPDKPPLRAKRINGLRMVEEKGNLFILGKPGAGKTTFLKYIAIKATEQLIDKVPIFISLKEWADSGSDLLRFVAECFDKCDFPVAHAFVEDLLKSGGAIVLFDGLDEVNQESGQRESQTREMNTFVEKYDRTQCLITCRIAASDYSFKPFTYVEIADFTEKQIEIFVGNWFRKEEGKDEETRDKFLAEFARADNKGLRDLARTPLLLTLLCLAFNETLTFPQRRVEIYEEALDALLKKWDVSRRIKRDVVYRKLSLGHKENMLARLAAETFERNEYFMPQAELERLITDYVKNVPPHDTNEAADAEAILKAIEAQHGIFVERARKVYSFSHLTFQEYFTAKYIVANAAKGTLTNLVKEHCADGRWREVFLLTTSLLPDAGQLMTTFRHCIDELIEEEQKLRDLLAWVFNQSNSVQSDTWQLRPYYLYVQVYYHSQSDFLDRALDRALNRALALARDNSFALALTRDFAHTRASARARARAQQFVSVRARARRASAFGRGRVRVQKHSTVGSARARDLEVGKLEQELSVRSMPKEKADAGEWQEYADELRVLIIKHGEIGRDWKLMEEQEERLAIYLNTTYLLQECLELAVMPLAEKKAMLNTLYCSPAAAADGSDAPVKL